MRYIFVRFPEGRFKALTFSYDDGLKTDIRLAELFVRHGMKGTFNICSDFMGIDQYKLTADEIREHILGAGQEIAVHGADHRAPGVQSATDILRDVLGGRIGLEQTFGQIVRGMAYPDSGINHMKDGMTYEHIRSLVRDAGIAYARTLGGDNDRFYLPEDWYAWMPTAHHNNPALEEYADRFLALDQTGYAADRDARLFYLWGHTYEFDDRNNWDLIERFCEKMSGRDDIWYATNGEIYDYVEAFRSLVFSADDTIVYNPTLYTVWFTVDGRLCSVQPGQTLTISA